MGILGLFLGSVEVCGEKAEILRLANLLAEYNIPFSGMSGRDDASLCFNAPYSHYGRICDLCSMHKVCADISVKGLPKLFSLYKKRAGLFIGAAFGIILVIVSNLFVWNIEIVGNERISESEILEYLEKKGLYEGALKKSVSPHSLALDAELEMDGVAWLSVNYEGTLARVEMRETVEKPDIYDNKTPTNIVAKCDGEIIYTEAVSGVCAVKRGDIVQKGELLIGGVVDSKAYGYKLQRARGRIIAKTYRTFSVSVPYKTAEKNYTGKKAQKLCVKVFGKTLSFGKKESPFALCDITEEESDAVLFSTVRLPFSVSKTVMREYTQKESTLSRDEALFEARRLMAETLSVELAGAKILSQKESVQYLQDKAVLTSALECVEDICTEELIDTSFVN